MSLEYQFNSVQFSHSVMSQLFAIPTAAHQASLSITNSQSLLKLMSVESVVPSNISSSVVPFSFRLQSFPASGPFQMSQFFTSGGWNIGVSAWASVLPMTIQGWFPLGCTGWISLQSKGLSRVFSNTTVQKHQSFGTHWYRSSMINLSLILECNLQSNFGFTHKLCITSL